MSKKKKIESSSLLMVEGKEDSIRQNTLYKDYILPYTDHLKANLYANNSQFNRAKSEIQIYLASKVPLVNSLGLGAVNGHWDFSHPVFDDIKQFLSELFSDSYGQ